jgi:hypothetical protein
MVKRLMARPLSRQSPKTKGSDVQQSLACHEPALYVSKRSNGVPAAETSIG